MACYENVSKTAKWFACTETHRARIVISSRDADAQRRIISIEKWSPPQRVMSMIHRGKYNEVLKIATYPRKHTAHTQHTRKASEERNGIGSPCSWCIDIGPETEDRAHTLCCCCCFFALSAASTTKRTCVRRLIFWLADHAQTTRNGPKSVIDNCRMFVVPFCVVRMVWCGVCCCVRARRIGRTWTHHTWHSVRYWWRLRARRSQHTTIDPPLLSSRRWQIGACTFQARTNVRLQLGSQTPPNDHRLYTTQRFNSIFSYNFACMLCGAILWWRVKVAHRMAQHRVQGETLSMFHHFMLVPCFFVARMIARAHDRYTGL